MRNLHITEPLVRKLLETVDAGLVCGLGKPIPGEMCVEAAISYALGEPHSDGPSCVEPCVRTGKITLNDANWSSSSARAKGMRKVAIAQLGSKRVVDPVHYSHLLAEMTIREIVPMALRSAATMIPSCQGSLEAAANVCEKEGTADAARAAYAAAYAAARAAARSAYARSAGAADTAAYAAAYAADAADAARVADAAAYAAYAAAYAAARAAARAAAGAADAADAAAADAAAYAARSAAYTARYAADAADAVLSTMADIMVRALKECGSPGCDWLWLTK